MRKIEKTKIQLANLIKELRIKHGYTQKEFASSIIELSERQLIRIEKSESDITMASFIVMLDNLKIDFVDFINSYRYNRVFNKNINNIYSYLSKNATPSKKYIQRLINLIYLQIGKENLSDSELEEIEFIEIFMDFKTSGDRSVIKEMINKNNSINKMQLWNISILNFDSKTLLYSLNEIISNENLYMNTKLEEYSLKIIINSLGLLIQQGITSGLSKYFYFFKIHCKRTKAYYYLPIYYYIYSIYQWYNNKNSLYTKYKNDSLKLAQLFQDRELIISLEENFTIFELENNIK